MSIMLTMLLLWIVPAAVLVLADLPVWPVDPQPRRDYTRYYDPRTSNIRWDLDGRLFS